MNDAHWHRTHCIDDPWLYWPRWIRRAVRRFHPRGLMAADTIGEHWRYWRKR